MANNLAGDLALLVKEEGAVLAGGWTNEVLIPRVRRAGGYAIPASCAARASRQPHLELTFASDQSMGAGQGCRPCSA
jgi:hypothetical protein